MKAFVVRPFGTKSSINFDDVHKELIASTLAGLEFQGSTTEIAGGRREIVTLCYEKRFAKS